MSAHYKHATWTSRTAFLMATIGGAVGLGNLWRFPYVAGENGGGGFVLIYLGFVVVLGFPLIIGETMMGRRGGQSAVSTMNKLIRSESASSFWRAIGWISVLIPVIGLSYYAVVAAWALDYIWLAMSAGFGELDAGNAEAVFQGRIAGIVRPPVLHACFLVITVAVVAQGVNRGIERASKVLLPALFFMVLILVGYGAVAGDFIGAFTFLFAPEFGDMTMQSVLIALGQALFSLAIGVGLLITYSAYMPREFSLPRSAAAICVGDTAMALLAGLAIFPIVFANGLDPAGGPGLIFITLPVAFSGMPGGDIVGLLFFVLLLFAAWTSAIGMLEPVVAWLVERFDGHRARLTIITAVLAWLLGLGSVYSFGILSDVHPLRALSIEKTFFELVDFGTANLLLPLNALLIALFAGWALRESTALEELGVDPSLWFSLWRVILRYFAPLAIAIVIVDLVT